MAVLWDGSGLVVKRVEVMPHEEPPKLRLHSANPDYAPYLPRRGSPHRRQGRLDREKMLTGWARVGWRSGGSSWTEAHDG